MKKSKFVILICVLGIILSIFTLNTSSTVIGTPQPASGDWLINNTTTLKNEIIDHSSNIIVNEGGSLILDNSTLKMNCETGGQYRITVKSGGAITIKENSHLTRSGKANYIFIVEAGASFEMTDSKLEYCGIDDEDYKLTGPYFACDGSITNSIVDNCVQGVIAENNKFSVESSTVKNSLWHNIEGRNTKELTLDNCDFLASENAIKCNVEFYAGCTGSIKNCNIIGAGHNCVWCMTDNVVTIENNVMEGAPYNGIWAADNCDLIIKNNIIKDNDLSGIWIEQNSKVVCTGNTIKDNGNTEAATWDESGHGFAAFDSDVVFSNNIVGNNWGHNFETTNCTATFENNEFSASRQKCNVEFYDRSVITAKNNIIDGAGHNCFWMKDNVKATIEGNTMKNSPHNGLWAANGCELTIKDNIIDTCAESGIWSLNCTLTIEDNEIKNCEDYGIYTEGCTVTESGNTFESVKKGEKFFGLYIQLKTLGENDAILGGSTVTLKDSSGNTTWSGVTNEEGLSESILVSSAETYTAEATWNKMSTTTDFTPTKNEQVILNLKEEKKDDDDGAIPGFEVAILITGILVITFIMKNRKKR